MPEPANASTEGEEQQEQKPADPFSLRQSRNLERLAKAATKFHRETSTAASQKSSLWGGSEFGTDLSDEQRARIQTWNELASIPESFAGDTATDTGSTYGASTLNPETDASTNVTVPDREDAVSSPSQRFGAGARTSFSQAHGLEDSDSESDFELDFLRNLEDLAYKNFASANYSKAEECLRRSVDRSTDDSSPRLTNLKTQLVLCYCVQEKWDAAFAILEILPKTKTIECLPIYELLQAVALGYQHTSRLEEASKTLKIALQAKRRILGRQSNGYYLALAHLARIFEDMGDSLEAEVVRHSIPAHITPPVSEASSSTTTLVKSLIDNHELIGKIFVKTDAEASDMPQLPPAKRGLVENAPQLPARVDSESEELKLEKPGALKCAVASMDDDQVSTISTTSSTPTYGVVESRPYSTSITRRAVPPPQPSRGPVITPTEPILVGQTGATTIIEEPSALQFRESLMSVTGSLRGGSGTSLATNHVKTQERRLSQRARNPQSEKPSRRATDPGVVEEQDVPRWSAHRSQSCAETQVFSRGQEEGKSLDIGEHRIALSLTSTPATRPSPKSPPVIKIPSFVMPTPSMGKYGRIIGPTQWKVKNKGVSVTHRRYGASIGPRLLLPVNPQLALQTRPSVAIVCRTDASVLLAATQGLGSQVFAGATCVSCDAPLATGLRNYRSNILPLSYHGWFIRPLNADGVVFSRMSGLL